MDDVRLDGKRIVREDRRVYILLNKPTGYVTSVRDPHAAHTVMELVKGLGRRVYPVGRLDADSAGLLLLTDDGDLTQLLTHPSHGFPKTYRVVARGEVSSYAATDLRHGVLLEDGMTAPAEVEWVDYDEVQNVTVLDITIHEGRNRQVRRMLQAVGYPVVALTRIGYGPLRLEGLAPGTWRKLRPAEVAALRAAASSATPSEERPVKLKPIASETDDKPIVAPSEPAGKASGPKTGRSRPSPNAPGKAGERQPARSRGSEAAAKRQEALEAEARALAEKLGRDRASDWEDAGRARHRSKPEGRKQK